MHELVSAPWRRGATAMRLPAAPMKRAFLVVAVLAIAGLSPSCTLGVIEESFDRTLTVDGPVRLEVSTRSGVVTVTQGTADHVRIRGQVRESGLIGPSAHRRIKEIATNPPIEQVGNVIRIGKNPLSNEFRGPGISYTIETPAETRIEVASGSGKISVSGVHGPAKLVTGSGTIEAENLRDDVSASSGSGFCKINRVQGRVSFTVGSGGVTIEDVTDDIRGTTGSGMISIARPGGRVSVGTGSGGISVSGAKQDVRATAGSGYLKILGNPAPHSFWELNTGSGLVDLDVPADSSFLLHAKTDSGWVKTDLPIMIEEQSRKELRARVGAGEARIEVRTSSGLIRIR